MDLVHLRDVEEEEEEEEACMSHKTAENVDYWKES